MYYDTGTGEPATVDIIRVSPEDATRLIDERKVDQERKKLSGTALFNFGAFLEERWRRNDIMWGRLDGVERLIKSVLPMVDPATTAIRDELIDRAHGMVLRDTLVRNGEGNLTELLCSALSALPPADASQQVARLLSELNLGDAVQQHRLRTVLMSLLTEDRLLGYVRDCYVTDRAYEPNAAIENAARAMTITGRVLDGIAKKQGVKTSLPRWLARFGLMAQGLIAVSFPGTFKQRWWSHGIKVLYAFEIVMVLSALALGGPEARSFTLAVLGVTVAVHLLSLVLGDAMLSKTSWLQRIAGATTLALLGLAFSGGWAIYNGGFKAVFCGNDSGKNPQFSIANKFCQ